MLRPVHDPDAGVWLDLSEPEWANTVTFGPPGFEAYGRLLILPDPEYPGQRWNDVDLPDDSPHDEEQIQAVLDELGRWTTTPDDAWFCLWAGEDIHGDALLEHSSGERRRSPAFPAEVLQHPSLNGPHRTYYLFRGALADLGQWGAADYRPGSPRGYLAPAFIWPSDRAWCLANDCDSHWIGIGAPDAAIAALCSLETVDVVRTDRGVRLPEYA